MTDEILELFAVRNRDGQWFRAKGYGGDGATWVNKIERARIYAKVGPAKACVTFFAKRWPECGTPDVVRLVVTRLEAIDQAERAAAAIRKIRTAEATRARGRARCQLESARRQLARAEQRIVELESEVGE